jgi:hypothetical protein
MVSSNTIVLFQNCKNTIIPNRVYIVGSNSLPYHLEPTINKQTHIIKLTLKLLNESLVSFYFILLS